MWGSENASDIMTKHLQVDTMEYWVVKLSCEYRKDENENGYRLDHLNLQAGTHIEAIDVGNLLVKVKHVLTVEYGHQGRLHAWHRLDSTSSNYRGTLRGGLDWKDVVYRAACTLDKQNLVDVEDVRQLPRHCEHRPLPWGKVLICTFLFYRPSDNFSALQCGKAV